MRRNRRRGKNPRNRPRQLAFETGGVGGSCGQSKSKVETRAHKGVETLFHHALDLGSWMILFLPRSRNCTWSVTTIRHDSTLTRVCMRSGHAAKKKLHAQRPDSRLGQQSYECCELHTSELRVRAGLAVRDWIKHVSCIAPSIVGYDVLGCCGWG